MTPSLNLAQCFVGKLNLDAALAETKAALEVERAAGPENNLAEIYLLKGDTRNALDTAGAVLAKDPGNVRALENRAWAYLLNGQVSEARLIFERMVAAGGDAESRGRSALADLALSSGLPSEAKRQLENGIAVDRRLGNSFAAGVKRISMLANSLELAAPLSVGDRELGDLLNDSQLLLLAGLVYYHANLRSELAKTYTQIDTLAKDNAVPALLSFREMLAARLALLSGNAGAAIEAGQRAITFEQSTLALQILAESYDVALRPRDAIDAYEKILARKAERTQSYDAPAYHELIKVHYHLGVLYDQMGDSRRARSHLEQFLHWWSHPEGASKIYKDAKDRLRRLEVVESRAGIPTPAM